jgi:hypothetical protein
MSSKRKAFGLFVHDAKRVQLFGLLACRCLTGACFLCEAAVPKREFDEARRKQKHQESSDDAGGVHLRGVLVQGLECDEEHYKCANHAKDERCRADARHEFREVFRPPCRFAHVVKGAGWSGWFDAGEVRFCCVVALCACFGGSRAADEQVGEFGTGDFPAKGVLEVELASYSCAMPLRASDRHIVSSARIVKAATKKGSGSCVTGERMSAPVANPSALRVSDAPHHHFAHRSRERARAKWFGAAIMTAFPCPEIQPSTSSTT